MGTRKKSKKQEKKTMTSKAKPIKIASPMSPKEFVQCATKLGRSIRSFAHTIGVGVRQSQRFSSGEADVPVPVRRLIRAAMLANLNAETLEGL